MNLSEVFVEFLQSTGFANITIGQAIMLLISFVLLYLAIVKGFEPLLLVPIAFGMLLANLPLAGLMSPPENGQAGGMLYYLYQYYCSYHYCSYLFL